MVSVESTLTHTAVSGIASVSAELTSAGLETAAANATSFFGSASSKDFLRAPLQIASQLEQSFLGLWNTFKVESLGRHIFFGPGTVRQAADTGAQVMADAAANAGAAQAMGEAGGAGWAAFFAEAFQASTFKSYWGMLHYITSRWAFTCFAMALILNRIGVYGASRQRIYLDWPKRLALRIVPILLFISQIHQLLQAIRCQTSPDFSLYRHGDNNKYSLLDWSKDGGALHTLSSAILFGSTDASACAAVGLSRPSPDVRAPRGSFSLLWPSFLRLSLSHIVESLSCSLQQIPAMTEVGMTVFEHSLAFAEAETALAHTLGLGLFGSSKSSDASSSNITMSSSEPTIPASGTILALADATASLTGPHILDRVNVPVEVLLVTLLSCGNSLTSHVLAVMGKQRRWRLVNTGIWGMAFMGSFVWGLFSTSTMVRGGDDGDDRPVSSLLHFPTVAIVGFLPHMAILLGIGVCFIIYLVALTFTAISLGTNPHIPQPSSLKERFSIAHDNLQAAIQTRGINIRWYEDFYTALLRVGFAALTAASESVFLNEGRAVEVRQFTWIEEDRLDEFEGAGDEKLGTTRGQQFQILEEYGLPSSTPGGTDKGGVWESGYSKERKFDKKDGELEGKDSFVYPTPQNGGVGAVQRTTRFYLLMIYLRGIIFLIAGYVGFGAGVLLDSIGITGRPSWLRKLVGRSLKKMHAERNSNGRGRMLDFWLIGEDGKLTVPLTDEIDIEPEMRRRLMTEFPSDKVDELLDSKLYDWWRSGGWFGVKDGSGDYQPPPQHDGFDDTTSVISMSTEATTDRSESGVDEDEDGWESEPDGTKTPTQASAGPTWSFAGIESRESSPFTDTPLDATSLARLLDPQDRESRDEARILAAHLKSVSAESPGIMTRSRYRREMERERARILLAGRTPPKLPSHVPTISLFDTSHVSGPRPLTNAEEAEVLESLILSRRKRKPTASQSHGRFDSAEDESSQAGPCCVVCQTSPRSIIAWPCRCLIVCEDCRISLALNNFGNCVTCRRPVQGFVRLYVP
ncbi:hypothetical protein PV08_01534 [Exophiala spinifera]|uniref:RING-type domain-containing protein n=1 Tax=Exophiala spinifera TaxID=91928 RepID=A0A0D2BRA1_9EURO|nr:uncharacterized protein PV08_01534 [Exophiala spinifera]KIW20955.1 hypothetical protein PV08_01534 [Exophiala spinifera]